MLSIIVPVYNVECFLSRCIDSILNQTYSDFEVILVDDGSTDECPAICDEYARMDSRVKVIHKANGGLSDARNAGIAIARGEYFGFVDSDDSIANDMYEHLMALIHKHNADIAACGILNLQQDGSVIGHWPDLTEDIVYNREDFISNHYPDVRRNIMPSVANKVFRRGIFETISFPVGKIYEDAQIQLEIYDQCEIIALCHRHLYFYYSCRPGSINNCNYSIKQFDMIDFSLKNLLFFDQKAKIIQQRYALEVYTNNYLKNYFQVELFHRDLRKQFKAYRIKFIKNANRVIRNPHLCKLKRIMIIISFICPKISYKISKKYFPECVYELT